MKQSTLVFLVAMFSLAFSFVAVADDTPLPITNDDAAPLDVSNDDAQGTTASIPASGAGFFERSEQSRSNFHMHSPRKQVWSDPQSTSDMQAPATAQAPLRHT